MAIGGTLAALIGTTGAAIIGGALLLGGLLLVTGASTGAILRRTGHVMKRRARARSARFEWPSSESQTAEDVDEPEPCRRVTVRSTACSTAQRRIPTWSARRCRSEETRRSSEERARPRKRRVGLRDVGRAPEYRLPDRALLRASPAGASTKADSSAKAADLLVRTLSEFGVEATVMGQISGPRVTRYELQLAPGTKVSKVAGLQGRPLLRARDHGDPHPRPDPRQAGCWRRGAEPLAEARHPRRHLRRPPCDGEPAVRVARQGHLRQRDLDRPRAHAAPPHRRHHRLGQVGMHQHDPHLDAAALDAGRGADDPHRPEADRARLLRVDPAPADARGLEPEGSRGRAHERRRRDGAPLRAALVRPRPQPARGEPRAPRARRGRRSRTSSSSSTSSPT